MTGVSWLWLLPAALAALLASGSFIFRKRLDLAAALEAPPAGAYGKGISPEMARKVRALEFSSKRLVESVFSGEYHSVFKGRGMAFSEVRQYAPGDDVRAIDWNVTARMGEPFIKVFDEERELTVILMVDASASGAFGTRGRFKSEAAAEICATIAFSAIKNNDKVGLCIFTREVELFIPPAKGRRHVLRIIRELLAFKPTGVGTGIGNALDRLLRTARRGGIVFMVSDFADEGYESRLRVAARKFDLIAIRITDPAEQSLPDAGLLRLRDPETGEERVIDASNADFRARFERAARERDEKTKKTLGSAGVDVIEISTDGPAVAPLEKFFRRREKRIFAGR